MIEIMQVIGKRLIAAAVLAVCALGGVMWLGVGYRVFVVGSWVSIAFWSVTTIAATGVAFLVLADFLKFAEKHRP